MVDNVDLNDAAIHKLLYFFLYTENGKLVNGPKTETK